MTVSPCRWLPSSRASSRFRYETRWVSSAIVVALGSLNPIPAHGDDVGAFDEPELARPSVWVYRDGEAAHIDADLWVNAPSSVAREALLDFAAHPSFIPGADSCRVVALGADTVRVCQKWSVRFITTRRYRAEIDYRVGEGEVRFRRVSGDLEGFTGRWRFVPDGEGTRVEYRSRLAYGLGAPWFLARGAVTRHFRRMMRGLGDEAERKARDLEET